MTFFDFLAILGVVFLVMTCGALLLNALGVGRD